MAVIYLIFNKRTKDSYLGSASGLPFGRWGDHCAQLKRHRHHSPKFQSAWDQSRLHDWDFQILESDIGETLRLAREQFWFERVAPTLNGTSRITKCIDRDRINERVAAMLDDGRTYREIHKETGMSLGWITLSSRRRT